MTSRSPLFSSLVEQRLAALGTNAFAAEQAAGLPPDAIRNVIRSQKKDGPSISRAKEICDALGLEFYIGPKRELSGFSEGAEHSDLGRAEALRAGYLPIPWHDAARRRGSAPVALQSAWLASEGLAPDHLRAIVPDSLKLSVTEAKNSVVVVDTVAAQKGASGLWCFAEGTTIGVSRAAFSSNVIVLFPAEEDGDIRIIEKPAPSTFRMLGKVIWLGVLT